jgi:hypothetical protein
VTLSGVLQRGFALILTATLVVGCGWRPGGGSFGGASDASVESTSAVPAVSRMSIAASKPVDAYVLLGGRIKTCWFNPEDPLLPNHVYRADVSPDGSKVKITIHEARNLGRAGTSTYAIDFKQEGPFTVVTTENRKMPPEMAAKMQFDIDRWKRGEQNCSKEMPKVAAQPQAAQ